MQRSRSRAIVGEIGIGFSNVRFGKAMRVLPGPQRKVRSWSGHSPPLSQTGQSSGWLTRMNSSVASCATRAISDVRAVLTFIPSWAVSVQPACGGGAERAEALAEDPVADVEQQVELLVRGTALLDRLEELHHPPRPLAARR